MSIPWINTFVLGFAVLVALAALVTAVWTANRLRSVRGELQTYSRSLDALLREARRRASEEAARKEEPPRTAARYPAGAKPTGPAARAERPPATAARAPAPATNPEERPAGGNARRSAGEGAGSGDTSPPARDERAARELETGAFELSLQPIVSVERGAAVGFEVFASVNGPSGRIDTRRPDLDGPALLSFEREILAKAIDAARRRIGEVSAEMPLHVPISGALLSSPDDIASLSELLRLHPGIARSVVLSVPFDLLSADVSAGLRPLADAGLAIAVDGWQPGSGDLPTDLQVSMLKAEAAGLIAPNRSGADGAAEFVRVAAASGARPAATRVEHDDEAIDLIDRGIDLMVGERFASPRLLRREDGAAASTGGHG